MGEQKEAEIFHLTVWKLLLSKKKCNTFLEKNANFFVKIKTNKT